MAKKDKVINEAGPAVAASSAARAMGSKARVPTALAAIFVKHVILGEGAAPAGKARPAKAPKELARRRPHIDCRPRRGAEERAEERAEAQGAEWARAEQEVARALDLVEWAHAGLHAALEARRAAAARR